MIQGRRNVTNGGNIPVKRKWYDIIQKLWGHSGESAHTRDTVNEIKDALPTNIRNLMERKGITEARLAREVNLPQPTINRLLSGKISDPKISTLVIIANFFEVSVDYLLGRKTNDLPENISTQKSSISVGEKESTQLNNQIARIDLDNVVLSNREKQCLELLMEGKRAKEIARILGMSDRTAESHLENIKFKFGCRTKSELIEAVIKESQKHFHDDILNQDS